MYIRFQWVKCQLDALCAFITDKSIRASLKQLPKGLDETYVRAFSKIRNDMGEDAVMIRRIFHWLVHSKRPLTLRELSEAVSIEFRQTRLDFSAIPTDPEDIFRFCGGLVTLSGHDNEETVNLSHFSIKESRNFMQDLLMHCLILREHVSPTSCWMTSTKASA